MVRFRAAFAAILVTGWVGVAATPLARAQVDENWNGFVELGYTATGGNSDTESFRLDTEASVVSEKGEFGIVAGGFQAKTKSFRRFAERSETGELILVQESSTSLSAENYWVQGRFRHPIGPGGLYGFERIEWDRDEPAGIRNRYAGVVGVGKKWVRADQMRFWTEYGVTVNRERRNVEGLEGAAEYPGLRFQWGYWWRIAATSRYRNDLTVNQNLDEQDDIRAVMLQRLEMDLTKRFSVGLGLQLKYDNDPAFARVPIFEGGVNTGERLRVQKDKLDRTFTTALTVSF